MSKYIFNSLGSNYDWHFVLKSLAFPFQSPKVEKERLKVYLEKNLKTIGSITQKYLRYPAISVRTRQSGTNIIEFTLHPNGDITQPIITSSSGYEALDSNTIKTIEIAYKDYPRPTQATKIRIYVTYRLY